MMVTLTVNCDSKSTWRQMEYASYLGNACKVLLWKRNLHVF